MKARNPAPVRRNERQSRQQRIRQRRRDLQQLAERYEVQAPYPEPEPQGLYRP